MRYSHHTLICILFLPFVLCAFQSNNDSKQSDADTVIEEHSTFITTYKNIDSIERFIIKTLQTNKILAKRYYLIYLDRGIKENNDNIQFISQYYLGDISYDLADYIESIHHSESALQIAEKQEEPRNQIVANNQLGNTYYSIRNYDAALHQYLKAYQLAQKNNLKSIELHILGNLSMIRTRIHRYEDALQSYQEIINKLQKEKYKNIPNYSGTYLSSIQGIGVCYFLLKKYDDALLSYQEGFELARLYNSEKHTLMFHMTSGEVYSAKKMYSKAMVHLLDAKRMIKDSEDIYAPFLHTTNYHIATVFYRKKEFKKGLDILEESFDIIDAEKETKVEKIAEMYDLALSCAEQIENTEKQIYYSKRYRNVIDSLHNDDIATKDMLYDSDKVALEEKNQNLTNQKTLYTIMSIFTACIVLILLIYNIKTQRKNKAIFEKLQHEIEKTKATSLPLQKKEFVTDEKAEVIFDKLHNLEHTNFYLKSSCSLHNTAKLIGTNTTYLSKMMNEYRSKSFNEYINELRIKYCLEKLKNDKKFRSYTIKAISEELGYKSVNTFGSAFKKQTGLTHSYYLKQVQKESQTLVEEPV